MGQYIRFHKQPTLQGRVNRNCVNRNYISFVSYFNSVSMDEVTLMGIAGQLRKPSGAYALKTGEMMNVGNVLINQYAIKAVQPKAGDKILEIGMGNGYFVHELLELCADIDYTGIDYSREMVDAAKKMHSNTPGNLSFQYADVRRMLFEDDAFDKIFTVNTLYFWDDRQKMIGEIKRVLRTGGELTIAIRPEHEMKHYPMTRWGFRMYSETTLRSFLEDSGFKVLDMITKQEPEQEFAGEMMPVSTLIAKAALL